MHYTPLEIAKLDPYFLISMNKEDLLPCLIKIIADLKESRDRLNQNSSNSSRPSSSDNPWGFRGVNTHDINQAGETLQELFESSSNTQSQNDSENSSEKDKDNNSPSTKNSSPTKKIPKAKGRKKGSQGFGRMQVIPVDKEVYHKPYKCLSCGHALEASSFCSITAREQLDLEKSEGFLGLKIICTKHVYGEIVCPKCSHKNIELPRKAPIEEGWTVELKEWRLIGPMLLAFICALSLRYRMSRKKNQEFLLDWLNLSLSVGEINRCIHEAGRAIAPLEKEMIEAIRNSGLVHSDETPWWEQGKRLWLWVFTCMHTTLFMVGSRGSDIPQKVLEGFLGWLVSDGYVVYRKWLKRLRCWSHLLRKSKGLSESVDQEAKSFGLSLLELLNHLKLSIYRSREGPSKDLSKRENETLNKVLNLCWDHQHSEHNKVRALSREILRDWVAVFAVLEYPHLPLTNNEAERSLRHWVIQRKISMGTRTPEGTRGFALLASVIETCRKRSVSPWIYLAYVVEERRAGKICPQLPAIEHNKQAYTQKRQLVA
jgi:DNA-directed RNA polymerase subunit RPC12/RpoP